MRRLALPLVLLVVALAGCGSDDAAPAVDESDKPGSTVACLEAQGVTSHVEGEDDEEVVLDAGPRVKFYLTAAEAEAAQFRGAGEGAEQIGSALLFVRKASDDTLAEVEDCLSSL